MVKKYAKTQTLKAAEIDGFTVLLLLTVQKQTMWITGGNICLYILHADHCGNKPMAFSVFILISSHDQHQFQTVILYYLY